MRVLLIEDDNATAQSIELMLQSEGFNVYTTDLGEEGVDLGKLYDYDIILLDLNLPDMSGYEVLKTLRVSKVSTPILILSGLVGIEDKVRGLGFGADDYMTKPFHKDELVARIHAIVRRSKGHAQSVIETGELKVNLDTKTVEVHNQRVHLTSKEYQMLELLSLRKGTTLTKEMFLNHLYGGMDEPELKIIDVFICKLRKKLQAATGGQHYIETVWGRGYVLRDPASSTVGRLSLRQTRWRHGGERRFAAAFMALPRTHLQRWPFTAPAAWRRRSLQFPSNNAMYPLRNGRRGLLSLSLSPSSRFPVRPFVAKSPCAPRCRPPRPWCVARALAHDERHGDIFVCKKSPSLS